jgi:hypothetical protein
MNAHKTATCRKHFIVDLLPSLFIFIVAVAAKKKPPRPPSLAAYSHAIVNNVLIYRNLEFDRDQTLEKRRGSGYASSLSDPEQARSINGFRQAALL